MDTETRLAVSLQLTKVAAAPPKETVMLPRVPPKADPEIATQDPTAPEPGASPTISGGRGAWGLAVSVVEPQIVTV